MRNLSSSYVRIRMGLRVAVIYQSIESAELVSVSSSTSQSNWAIVPTRHSGADSQLLGFYPVSNSLFPLLICDCFHGK